MNSFEDLLIIPCNKQMKVPLYLKICGKNTLLSTHERTNHFLVLISISFLRISFIHRILTIYYITGSSAVFGSKYGGFMAILFIAATQDEGTRNKEVFPNKFT